LQEVIGYALRRAQGAVYSDLSDALARISLRPLQYTLLLMVKENPGASQSGVCDALGIQKANCVPTMSELERRGLIIRRSQAQKRLCKLKTEPIRDAVDWLEHHRKLWEDRLDRLDDYLKELQQKEKEHGRHKK
jgi:DNA-binding MarR family transcriptional regulator